MPFTRMLLDGFLGWDPGDPSGAKCHNHLMDRLPCRSVTGPGIVPRVRADMNYRVPDLAVTCEPPTRDQMLHRPVLLVEILSPSNEAETNVNIWAFTTIPSVQEILAIHSTRIAASLLRRDPDGSWPSVPIPLGSGDTLVLDSIGSSVPLRACYRTTILAV